MRASGINSSIRKAWLSRDHVLMEPDPCTSDQDGGQNSPQRGSTFGGLASRHAMDQFLASEMVSTYMVSATHDRNQPPSPHPRQTSYLNPTSSCLACRQGSPPVVACEKFARAWSQETRVGMNVETHTEERWEKQKILYERSGRRLKSQKIISKAPPGSPPLFTRFSSPSLPLLTQSSGVFRTRASTFGRPGDEQQLHRLQRPLRGWLLRISVSYVQSSFFMRADLPKKWLQAWRTRRSSEAASVLYVCSREAS